MRVHLIAGEPSGDRLGAALMRALLSEREVSFTGLGGMEMTEAGLEPLFDINDIAVMGLVEVLPRLRLLKRRLNDCFEHVLASEPDCLVTIDSPSFGLRVAKRVREVRPGLPIIHYVAPSVWAWRPGRAKEMAAYVNHVLALLPFEPPYMEAAGMTCDFVGHPVAEREQATAEEVAAFRAETGGGPLLLMAPGSRRGEVRRHFALMGEVARRMASTHPDLRLVVPVAETVEPEVAAQVEALGLPARLVRPGEGEAVKRAAFAAADAGLVKSGTITLEMAAAGTPMVAVYVTAWLTAQIVRRIVKVDTANLVNLLEGGKVVPEFLQEYATVDAVSGALEPLLAGGAAREAQMSAFCRVMETLGRGGEPPSRRAARSVLAAVERLA